MREIGIGIIGVGVVGSSVVKILQENANIISARIGAKLVVKKGVVRDLNKVRDVDVALTTDRDCVIQDPEIEIIIELMGGVEEAYEVAKEVLQKNKSLVTANKAMLAYHRYELEQIAKNNPIGFEASVCGGIPIIKALKDGLGANHILSLRGILNGTSNYILTQMSSQKISFKDALKSAQELGYAEADPSLDIHGQDAGHKLLILASLAYGIDVKPEEIIIEGITQIDEDDIAFAKEFDFVIKPLGIAKKIHNEIELRVHPVLIDKNKMIAKVDGVMNAISVIGDCVGETLYYGAGAGGDATASAVISDLIEIGRGKNSAMLGFEREHFSFKIRDKREITSRYYLRLSTFDRAGVLSKVAGILSQNDISIEVFLQKQAKENIARLCIITHVSLEANIIHALEEIDKQEFIVDRSFFIRIEDFQ
ncbi:homoserine dehydrogenase [Helicobacter mustelae]|uniref:Homoserine dehydrogenase n=1 Tax=Helicobacter mustelae (strain ATCC 43772 / CCUG 25715 / CIP 103759 / LMG 18044 / NCTC 12198 / R85-136P) TaxID=679897 RepID=D3UIB3_HELM1|nr:homoserine dehydrogenase [Helicobacter mustelae]CBG40236.1 homoserine dehydrogenase [Helicobacter mustelae 12198]SQH71735.1 homoserine dehydrogenase [Helicobacter mustelae]STP12864.1 homoserine dehydrogenase [Helicobacter mustelae]